MRASDGVHSEIIPSSVPIFYFYVIAASSQFVMNLCLSEHRNAQQFRQQRRENARKINSTARPIISSAECRENALLRCLLRSEAPVVLNVRNLWDSRLHFHPRIPQESERCLALRMFLIVRDHARYKRVWLENRRFWIYSSYSNRWRSPLHSFEKI